MGTGVRQSEPPGQNIPEKRRRQQGDEHGDGRPTVRGRQDFGPVTTQPGRKLRQYLQAVRQGSSSPLTIQRLELPVATWCRSRSPDVVSASGTDPRLWRVAGEDEIPRTCGLVAWGTSIVLGRVRRLAVLVELRVSPSARRGILPGILGHYLQVPVGGRPGDKGLRSAEYLVVLVGRNITVRQTHDDGSIGKRKNPVAVCLQCYIVTQDRTNVVEAALFMSDRNEPPIAVLRRGS